MVSIALILFPARKCRNCTSAAMAAAATITTVVTVPKVLMSSSDITTSNDVRSGLTRPAHVTASVGSRPALALRAEDYKRLPQTQCAGMEGYIMSLEVLSTAAAIGTFFVIAATAVAALIQLRHMRSGNEIVAVTEFRETYESAHFNDARQRLEEIIDQIDDPRVRSDLMKIPLPAEYQAIRIVANLFETLGAFVKHGVVDENIACDLW